VDSNRLLYFLVFDNRISSQRLSPINVLCHSSSFKDINKHFLFLYTEIYLTNIGRGTISHIARILLIFSSGQTKLIARQKHESHNPN